MRSLAFFELWQQVFDALGRHRAIHADFVDVLLRVGRHGMEASKASAKGDEDEQKDDEVLVEQCVLAPAGGWHADDKLRRKYGHTNIEALHGWWCAVGAEAVLGRPVREPLRWVSTLQLYCDFWLTTKFPGLVSPSHGQWYDSEEGLPVAVSTNLSARSTMFIRALKAYWKFHDVQVPCSVQRPWSYALSFWTQCYRLPWPKRHLEKIDRALLSLRSRQFARSTELTGFFVSQLSCDDWD